MKRTYYAAAMALLLACRIPCGFDTLPASAADTDGMVGEAVCWQVTEDTLTLSGTGATVQYLFRENDKLIDCPWEDYRQEIRHIVVEEGITELGNNLFALMPNLETVSLPESLNNVRSYCFADNPLLREINYPDHADFGYQVFDNCPSLRSELSDASFLILTGGYLYSYVGTEQTSVTVPEGVTRIGYEAFFEHSELKQITLPDSVQRIDEQAFTFCSNLWKIKMPNEVKVIGSNAFNGCSSLTQLTLPSTVTEIAQAAFYNCASLEQLSLPEQQAARGEFLLPPALTRIGVSAFSGCTKLQTITIPETCTYLGKNAFQGCTALAQCKLPNSLRYVSATAFADCPSFQLPGAADGFYHLNDRYLYRYDGTACVMRIPEGTTLLADSALQGMENLIEVTCPDTLLDLNDNCFADCKYLTALHLNEGLLTIGTDALRGCTNLTELTIPASVTEIAAQSECALTDIYGTTGTAAEQFAQKNGIAFHDIAEKQPPQGKDMTLDYETDGWYFGNSREAFHNEYYLTEEDLAAVLDFCKRDLQAEEWIGSCFGLSLSVVLAKNGLIPLGQLQSGARTLSELEPTRQLESMINFYHAVQFSGAYVNAISATTHDSPARQMWGITQLAQNIPNGESPFLLSFSMPSGSHAVVGYGQELGEWTFEGRTYDGRILVWDPNFPTALHEDSCLYYDSVTLDYCIPYYGTYYIQSSAENNSGKIQNYCNNMEILNILPYPFAAAPSVGDLDGDGTLTVADAVLLSRLLAEDETAAPADFSQADVDADGILTILDLTALLKKLGVS